jgi:LmbE family N-acetylglucosaminyl deacetylase
MNKINLSVFIVLVFILLIAESGLAKIIVFAPHPDDEALMFSGIIYRALAMGEPVKVVVITNGDYRGIDEGYVRQGESVNAMNVLGVDENDIIFLGYPDSGLETIYYNYTSSDDVYVSHLGQAETYGNRGLGGADYHTYTFGLPGAYNKPNILMDLENILGDFLPDHIYVTSEFDIWKDHSATYLYVRDALLNISGLYPNYRPVVHSTLIHGGDDSLWPTTIDPKSLFTPPLIMSTIPLNWNLRESINVPLIMQSMDLDENLKRKVILKYVTQVPRGGTQFLERFLHKDEFYWAENILGTNTPPVVEAGGDQAVDAGSLITLDGTGSLDPDGDLLSYSWIQTQGTSVILSDPTSPIPSFNAPTGLLADETLEFGLVVNDGEFESIMDTVAVTVASNYANIAPLSSAVASSEKSGTSSFASAAIDGYVDGSPNDESREWASDGELAGAWITLSWPDFYVVDRIILYDRINSTDQIIDATLTFSDGSFIEVGPLLNDGSGNIINFPMKNIFRVTLTVNEAFGQNAGLAEIEVYGEKTDIAPNIIVAPI